jgi:hypothetical protein
MINWFVELMVSPGFDPAIGWISACMVMVVTAGIHFEAGFSIRWSATRLAVFTIIHLAASVAVVYCGIHFLAQLYRLPPAWDDVSFFKTEVSLTVVLALLLIALSFRIMGGMRHRIT